MYGCLCKSTLGYWLSCLPCPLEFQYTLVWVTAVIFNEKFRKQMDLQLHLFILLIFWFFIFLSLNLFFLDQTKYSLQNPGASQTANSPEWLHDQPCQAGQSAQSRKDSFLEPETTNTQVGSFPTVTLSWLVKPVLTKVTEKPWSFVLLGFSLKGKKVTYSTTASTELYCITDFPNTQKCLHIQCSKCSF